MSDKQTPLFDKNKPTSEETHGDCPECGSILAVKHSNKNSFIGCVSYPACEYTRSLVDHEKVDDKLLPGTHCPKCESTLAVKQGRYGMFIGCSDFPNCDHIENNNHQTTSVDEGVDCPSCKPGTLFEKTNRFGKTFYACDHYPTCKYVLNHQPLKQTCPECHWSVMIKRQMSSGEVHMCPQKKCGYKLKI